MLLRAYLSSAIPILVKAGSGILLIRVFVEYLGKEGLGLASQFQGFILLLYALFNALFYNHIAQGSDNKKTFRQLLGLVLILSACTATILIAFSKIISEQLVNSESAKNAIYIAALCCPVIGIYVTFSAKLCSDGKQVEFNLTNAVAIILSTILLWLLVINLGQKGTYYGFAVYYLVPTLFLIFIASKQSDPTAWLPSFKGIRKYPINNVLKIGFVGIASAVSAVGLQLLTRNQLSNVDGWALTGDWQALTKVSESYLLLVTAPLATFLLPQLAKNKLLSNQKKLVLQSALIGVCITVTAGVGVYFLWDSVITSIIGKSFLELKSYIPLQILGDILKTISWTLSIAAIARLQYKTLIISEIIFACLYGVFILWLVPNLKLNGAIASYVAAYGITLPYLFYKYYIYNRLNA
jgi:polysaccharide transporter, PST family